MQVNNKPIPVFSTKLPKIIETADHSLLLRLISEGDLEDFYHLGMDRDVAKFNNFNIRNIEDAKKKMDSFLGEINNLERISYAIIKNDKFVGYYGIWLEDNHPNYFREGVAIMPEYRRQGIYSLCSEAMVRVLSAIYKHIHLVENVDSLNAASIAASESRGFIQEGLNEIGELRFVKRIS